MITAEKIQKLVEVFNGDSDITSMSSQTGFGFLMDGSVPKFEKIQNGRGTPMIVHPMYLYIDHWGGKSLRVYLSQKLTSLSSAQYDIEEKSGFEYWVPSAKSPIVVKRYLNSRDYADEATLETALEETLKEYARVYLLHCQEWKR